ncbi:MAG: hypothetical protein FWD66_05785 [Paludibacter sp.]|nr:hypothetical protein [Paludibacter sp.]
MTKNALVRNSTILGLLIILLIFLYISKIQKKSLRANCSFTKIVRYNEQNNPLLIQDSLEINADFLKTVIYFGYKKNKNDSLKWDDIIEIYQIRNNDTVLNNNFIFFRQMYEGVTLLNKQSCILDEKIYPPSFIVYTAISKGNFSENFFIYNKNSNKYSYEKRINYINYYDADLNELMKGDTIGLKTVFEIKNKYLIDSIEMNKLFYYEKKIYDGVVLKNSEWIIK